MQALLSGSLPANQLSHTCCLSPLLLQGRDYPGIHIGPEPTTDRWGGSAAAEQPRMQPQQRHPAQRFWAHPAVLWFKDQAVAAAKRA